VQIEPEQFGPRLAPGQVHLGLGDVPAAIAELEKAVRLAPGSPQTHYVLSVAYARAGRQADAERERLAFAKLSAAPPGLGSQTCPLLRVGLQLTEVSPTFRPLLTQIRHVAILRLT
jgi:hypothetical protein